MLKHLARPAVQSIFSQLISLLIVLARHLPKLNPFAYLLEVANLAINLLINHGSQLLSPGSSLTHRLNVIRIDGELR